MTITTTIDEPKLEIHDTDGQTWPPERLTEVTLSPAGSGSANSAASAWVSAIVRGRVSAVLSTAPDRKSVV